MAQLFLNNARCVLAESVSAADDLLQVKNAVNIPSSLDDGNYILLTLFRDTSRYGDNIEVVKVTYISRGKNPGELKLSVERGYEFEPQIHTAGERIEARLTAQSLRNMINESQLDSQQVLQLLSEGGELPGILIPNASATKKGGIKIRLNGTTAYISSTGSNA